MKRPYLSDTPALVHCPSSVVVLDAGLASFVVQQSSMRETATFAILSLQGLCASKSRCHLSGLDVSFRTASCDMNDLRC